MGKILEDSLQMLGCRPESRLNWISLPQNYVTLLKEKNNLIVI